jgi:formate hydrogenlyase subunit 3/multisubunit Na+/H+ antiporter MnhD subunit
MSLQLPVIIVVCPLVISFLIFLSVWWSKRAGFHLAIAALLVCLVSSFVILKTVIEQGIIQYWLGGWRPPWGIEYRVDHFNAFMLVLVSSLALISAIYARRTVEFELPDRVGLFWSLYLLLITGLFGIILTGDMFNLFVLIEVASLTSYSLIAIFTLEFITDFLPLFDILCWIAATAIIVGSIVAMVQNNLKKMLAYSSIANVGYIVLAIGLAPFTPFGLTPALMHILNHAVIKGCMFMAACAFIYKLDLWDIRKFEGLGRKMPYTCFAMILAALAMIGMPPSAGFITKWYLILAALDAKKYLFVAVIFFSTLLMIIYFWRVVEIMYIRAAPSSGETSAVPVDEAPLSMLIPTLTLGVLTFVIGIGWISGLFTPLVVAINSSFGLGVLP